MRHDAIHPMACACDRCAGPAKPAPYVPDVVDPADLAAARAGLILGALTIGMFATVKFGPGVAEWLTR
ncbi:MAG: hypothetical protein U9R64_12855 [Pseudomonadota bacterium]|nr:hypothetical protein [Pseudomonadota bacterium]